MSKFCFLHAIFLLCISCLTLTSGKVSLLSPPWKHCVHNIFAVKTKWVDIQSDNYPNGINKQTQCSWIINVSPGYRVQVAFLNLNLTGTMGGCFTQYLLIYEVETGQKLERFCGSRQPGDYVSHGKTIRIDLLADTVATPHAGFKMRVKATRLWPGFKKTFSFTKQKPKPTRRKNNKKKKVPPSRSSDQANVAAVPAQKNGGKVDLNLRRKLREQLAKGKRGNGTKVTVQRRPPSLPFNPQRVVDHNKYLNLGPNNDDVSISKAEEKDDETKLNLYIVIGIPAAGLLMLIIIGVLIKICICDAKKKKKEYLDTNQNKAPVPTPLQAMNHPIQRRQDLPGAVTFKSQAEVTQPVYRTQNTQSSRSSKNSNESLAARPAEQTLDVINNDVITNTNAPIQGTLLPVNGGYMFYCPPGSNVNTLTSNVMVPMTSQRFVTLPGDDEGYGTSRTLGNRSSSAEGETKRKKVPTLKRKLSEWEKSEIKKASRKI